PAIPGEIIPEWWATSSRNGGRNYLGMGGRHHSGIMGGLLRNPQAPTGGKECKMSEFGKVDFDPETLAILEGCL
ncbi:MAG: hypothetical protein WAN75_32715, partial [Xanthobacteraceae bacterium]